MFYCNVTVPDLCITFWKQTGVFDSEYKWVSSWGLQSLLAFNNNPFKHAHFIVFFFFCTGIRYIQIHDALFGTCVLSVRQLQLTAKINTHISGLFLIRQTSMYTFGPTAQLETFAPINFLTVKSTLQAEFERILAQSACWITW